MSKKLMQEGLRALRETKGKPLQMKFDFNNLGTENAPNKLGAGGAGGGLPQIRPRPMHRLDAGYKVPPKNAPEGSVLNRGSLPTKSGKPYEDYKEVGYKKIYQITDALRNLKKGGGGGF
jgi:hypothetical protein